MKSPIVVIGAGAAGIAAAWRAAQCGAPVTVLEKTDRIGTKILISGGGKCNITHAGPIADVLKAFRPAEARFLRPSCHRFTNDQIIEVLTTRGLEVYTREDGRIFPVKQTAKDVVRILGQCLAEEGVEVRLQTAVARVVKDDQGAAGVESETELFASRQVILATGGSSYPKSGTTGDGWPWAKELGHSIVPVRASLAPIELRGEWAAWAGISLRDVRLKARFGGKPLAHWDGDLLFTHHGISGPTALGISREVAERLSSGPVTLEVDLDPLSPFEAVQERMRVWKARSDAPLGKLVEEWLPRSLVEAILQDAALSSSARGQAVTHKQLNKLTEAVKAWRLGEVRTVPLEKGECVAGGVSLDEVDPHSMRSSRCPGLYVCGEVLDIAGPVGGYNLQAAFATGYVAGESAAADWHKQNR